MLSSNALRLIRCGASASGSADRASAMPSRTSRVMLSRSCNSLSRSAGWSAISTLSFIRVIGVCKSWEIAARIRARSCKWSCIRFCIALKARAARCTSCGPFSASGPAAGVAGCSVSMARVKRVIGATTWRTAYQAQNSSNRNCATSTSGSQRAMAGSFGHRSMLNGAPSRRVTWA